MKLVWLLSACVACGDPSSQHVGIDAAADGSIDVAIDAAIDAPVDAAIIEPVLQGVQKYGKASNTNNEDWFGFSGTLSGDGKTLAIGAPYEDSAATGIGGDQLDNTKPNSGAVYIYVRSGAAWVLEAYVKASNTDENDEFGSALDISNDGNTLIVAALKEGSCTTADPTNNACYGAGAAYVFVRSGTSWSQQAYLKASNARNNQAFTQHQIAISGDGNTVAVGQPGDPSEATGINADHLNMTGRNNGSVHVFTRTGTIWSQQAYIKPAYTTSHDAFGDAIALSKTGNVLAVAAPGEDSNATGVNGNSLDENRRDSGAAYVFQRTGGAWAQDAYIKASNPDVSDELGFNLALSADGKTLAVSSIREASNATGVNGNQADNSELTAGAVYVFTRTSTWSQQAYLKPDLSANYDHFGWSLDFSASGNVLAISAPYDNRNPPLGVIAQSGAAFVFRRTGTTWMTEHKFKASPAGNLDAYGKSIAIANDGAVLAITAQMEDGASIGFGGDQTSEASANSGAVYVVE